MGVAPRVAAPAGFYGPLPHRNPLPDPRRPGRRLASPSGGRLRLDGASDHGVSEALYLRDPDENGVELYRDRPKSEWPRTVDGELTMFTAPLDVQSLLGEE